ncbi:MAG: von Willebrand factor type A domain-containing protein, partial [Chloroflexi bacterium]|nr:von Willebrand factor type A domain-containing protein [Chloroflexota bacterium]
MKHYRKLAVIALSAAVMSVLLAACSASESPASRTLSTQASAPTAVAARASTTMESQQGAPGQPALAATSAPAPANVYSSSASPSGEGTRTLTVQLYDLDSGNRIGGTANVNDAPYDATFFKHYGVNPFIDTEDDQFSTFAMDVDTASYTIARRFVMDGYLPDPDSVRVEEFVNYFDQGYEQPEENAFAINIEGAPSPFGDENYWLMRVGLQGRAVSAEERKDATLIFVIDVSGSMDRENRLGLVKKSLELLVDELRPTDEVGIVIYGSRGQVVLNPTSGEDKRVIMRAIRNLRPGGATNAAEGLTLGYEMAARSVEPGRISRVILLSDGVANVGNTGSNSILKMVKDYVEQGVMLTTVGFGMGNYNDILMEQLADNGDGNYAYVDNLSQAKSIFVENLAGTLQAIAIDSKVQVDFNPEVVSRYRLIGYENRRVADQDFRNDAVDAGEVGANHSVTALYELKFHEGAEGRATTVFIRYEDPETGEVVELSRDFDRSNFVMAFDETTPRFQLAATVAEYAEILRE